MDTSKGTFTTNDRLLSQVFSSYNATFDTLCELINNSIQAKLNEIKIDTNWFRFLVIDECLYLIIKSQFLIYFGGSIINSTLY